MAKRKANGKAKAEPVTLELLAAAPFKTRAAVRAFVAGDEYQTLARFVGYGCVPADELGAPIAETAREAADFLSQDLAALARLAAQNEAEPFAAPVSSRGYLFSQRAGWLGALAVAMDLGCLEHADGAARVFVAQLDAIEKEEAEAWGHKPPSARAL